MAFRNQDLLYVLLKLRSYLISLIDVNNTTPENFNYTEEYLDRRFPEIKAELMELLIENDFNSDKDIIVDPQIYNRFVNLSKNVDSRENLAQILGKMNISTPDEDLENEDFEKYKSDRDFALKEVVDLLLRLARTWASHQELESIVDQYFILEEEEVLRSEEINKLDNLASNAAVSLRQILVFTKKYLHCLIDYYFKYGGDLPLNDFVRDLESIKREISYKYIKLFKENGLDKNDLDEE